VTLSGCSAMISVLKRRGRSKRDPPLSSPCRPVSLLPSARGGVGRWTGDWAP